jgi:hypothetical protein
MMNFIEPSTGGNSSDSRLVSHPLNGLQDYIAVFRYARYDEGKKRRETWAEGVARVRDMHLGH